MATIMTTSTPLDSTSSPLELSRGGRWAVLIAAFLGLMFDGFELGLMPVASLSVTQDLLGNDYTNALGGQWFAWFTAALMLGAAIGGSLLGNLGDRVGRARAMGISILFYSLFAGMGAFVTSLEQMLLLRFLVGLGVGGMWPNGVALVAECWSSASKPTVSGILGAGINVGVLALSQLVRFEEITPDSWRWIFMLSAFPTLLGVIVLTLLPESPKWLAFRGEGKQAAPRLSEMFRGDLLRPTVIGILLASVPLIGAWAGSKWVIPWADKLGEAAGEPGYKAATQGWWALGATIGSFVGSPIAAFVGRRLSYFLISLGATVLTWGMFRLTAPLEPNFLYVVFAQGLVATLFFGWLPLYLPELFPLRVRATGAGLSMNIGRFATAAGVLSSGALFTHFGNHYSAIGAACALVYATGMIVILWSPTTDRTLQRDT
jgi:SHS family sialic acid transporter-like MFS transporter